MRFYKIILCASLLVISQLSYAFYCSTSNGNGYINMGDTPEQVARICGNPDTVNEMQTPTNQDVKLEYWTYTHQPIQARANNNVMVPLNMNASHTTYPPDVTFLIVNNVVKGITVQGKQVSSSNLCRTGMTIRLGQTAQSILDSCGRADFINTTHQTKQVPPSTITTWTYELVSGTLVLQFKDGQLSQIQ
jgi:hypothetical protein